MHHDGAVTEPCSDSTKRNADIVRATAGHEGTRLRHTIRVVGKLRTGQLAINTDSDQGCEWRCSPVEVERSQGRVQRAADASRRRTGRARVDFHRHSVEIVFSERSIGNPASYGWIARTGFGNAGRRMPSIGFLGPGCFSYINTRWGETARSARRTATSYGRAPQRANRGAAGLREWHAILRGDARRLTGALRLPKRRLRTPRPRLARPRIPSVYRRVGGFLLSNRHRASPHREARSEATTPRRPEMRAHGNEGRLGRRFAIVIGVAAAGVMALGAQTATSTTGAVDRIPPDLQLSGDKKQNPTIRAADAKALLGACDGTSCDVIVEVSCGDEECTARATGRLTKVKKDKLDAGPATGRRRAG